MPAYLNRSAEVQCAHQGTLKFPPDPQCTLVVNGSEVLLKRALLATPIIGCTWVGIGRVPCTKVVSLQIGDAYEIEVDGDAPILDNLQFTTNGNGPPGVRVLSNSSSDVETLNAGNSSAVESEDWDVSALAWSQSNARPGDQVHLRAQVRGLREGTPVLARIYEYRPDGRHEMVRGLPPGSVKGGQIDISWTYAYHKPTEDIETSEEARKQNREYVAPQYFFELRVAGRTFGSKAESKLLKFLDFLDFVVVDDSTGDPIPDLDLEITFPDGSKTKAKLNPQGRCRRENVPPGRCAVVFQEGSGSRA